MTEHEVRSLVAEVVVLRGTTQYRDQEHELIAAGAVLNSQVGGPDIMARCAELRAMAPGPLLLQCDLETGSAFAADGTEIPPLMAVGATGDEELAFGWGHAIGLEGRRLGLDLTWSPVLDINTNPDNPIINIRSFGEDRDLVARLGAAVVRGLRQAGLEPCAKHWPGHGDVAVDSHIALPTVNLSRERLETVEWEPYRRARAVGLESIMTGHLLVPDIDPHNCATVSPTLIGMLRHDLGFPGPIITDSMGMEGLRLTLDSAEAAWRALAAGHDQVLIDYKRSPLDAYKAVLAACADGRVPETRLRAAAACVRAMKARRAALPPPPPADEIRRTLREAARMIAEASITSVGPRPQLNAGDKPLFVICDDLQSRGVGIADEQQATGLQGQHPLGLALRERINCETIVLSETPSAEEAAHVQRAAAGATAIIGATFAHIVCYKGEGVRLPQSQQTLWKGLAQTGKLQAMLLFESPYAISDLPPGLPLLVGYGADEFTLRAAVGVLLGELPCAGKLPVTVS